MRLAPLFALTATAAAIASAHASTVIDNANGYTLNANNEIVQFSSLAIDDNGRIIAVGKAADVAAKAPGAKHVDMQGRTLIPGLIDAHGHVFGLGEMLTDLDLTTTTSLPNALQAIGNYSKANAQNPWLIGRGWNQEIWKLGRFPTAQELDGVVSDRPVWLKRVDGHAGWANTKTLQLAGIDDKTPDPVGGKIMRDANGHATGVLVDAAQELVERKLPQPTEAQARQILDKALAEMARVGLTSVHDAGIGVGQDRLYRDYADHGKLTARVYGMISGTERDFDELAVKGPLNTYANDMYALRAVKLYADGALGSRGAALIKPYSDEPHTHGLLFRTDAQIRAAMEKAMKKGYQVNVHAIGDAGNKQILDGFAKLMPKWHTDGLRNRIEHSQIVQPQDIPRFKTLGIIPSMQPTHATSDMNMAETRVGHERIKGAYAWRSFLHQGSKIACGSDFPVESPNPFYGLHAAVTREDHENKPVAGWYPNQAMSLKEAFRCFTLNGAYAAHQEKVLGSLEPGKWADFIVIDRDLFTMPTYDIYKTQVLQTWVAGRQVYAKQ
ncbi:amidohydrolase [Massilia arenosa]|uniref:Amidohydrolase n=1 Tax=Zemynaea arenosa TaxID=2561931 RepID=A0A4Y9SQC4_9BURK|nr:amidohydrolase [Massilia arenosa]TFW28860.1 amidohydrolase [Massilia arenosa]